MSQLLALSIAVTVSLFLSTSISVVMMKPLRGVLNQVRDQEQRYLSQGGGLNEWQRDRLNQRLDDVAGELHN